MSPPARRRGSKQQQQALVNRGLGSPPARRRGSKPEQRADDPGDPESPPARRRGSKPAATARRLTAKGVASCAEAWIETGCGATGGCARRVASCAEAWIETSTCWPTRRMSGVASRSEEHTSELQSLMRISYAVFCLKTKKKKQ